MQLESLEKLLIKDEDLTEKYYGTIRRDLNNVYAIEFPDAEKAENWSDEK